MKRINEVLLKTLELLLDEQRDLLNTAYARRDCYTKEDLEYRIFEREVEKRKTNVKSFEYLMTTLSNDKGA